MLDEGRPMTEEPSLDLSIPCELRLGEPLFSLQAFHAHSAVIVWYDEY
jgi:hypothetical protein